MRLVRKRSLLLSVCTLALVGLAAAGIFASPELAGSQGPGNANTIANNTPGFIHKAKNIGPVDPSTMITVTVWLHLRNGGRLDQLAQQMYRKGSPNYHKWLNQTQFNAGFAPTAQAVNAVENFLTAHRLSVLTVAENNFYIKVQGTVGDVERAFHVQIDNYNLNGKTYRSNTGNPSIGTPLRGLVAGITGMDDLGFHPDFVRPKMPNGRPFPMIPLSSSPNGLFYEGQCFRAPETHTFPTTADSSTIPQATYTGNRYGADITNSTLGHLAPCGYQPSELQTAYNMMPLYNQGLDGTGQTIVITDAYGSPTIQEDAALFSQIYGLPQPDLTVLRAPGVVNNPHGAGWDTETTLDVEWAHAMAPGAKIVLVIGPTNHGDLDEAVNWAVVHNLGNTISNSWSTIEGFANPVVFNRDNRILEMAAVKGIDVNFATGDEGDFANQVGFRTVGFPASSPFATGIGGTSLALNPDNTMAEQTGWGTNLTLIAYLDSDNNPPAIPPTHYGFQFGAGGGTSMIYAKPSFQSGLSGNMRMVPDVSFLADPYTGVEIIQTGSEGPEVGVVGGTSLATPMFSGIMAIAAQKAGHGLGQAAQLLYSLSAGAVTDIVPVGSATNVSGTITTSSGTTNLSADDLATPLGSTTTFFSAFYNSPFSTRWFVITFGTDSSLTTATGWDNVTGVGTPNGANFVNAIAP
jgi:subtilase family serine protease